MKHTIGNWEASIGEDNGNGEFVIYQDESGTICRGDNEMINWKGNACLISAAPELLEALEVCVKRLECIEDYGHGEAIIENAKQAIQKARGESCS